MTDDGGTGGEEGEPLENIQHRAVNVLIPVRYGAPELSISTTLYQVNKRTDAKQFRNLPEGFTVAYTKFDVMRNCAVSRVYHRLFPAVPDGDYPAEYIYTE